jgi:hypothetical protein
MCGHEGPDGFVCEMPEGHEEMHRQKQGYVTKYWSDDWKTYRNRTTWRNS